MPFALPRGLTNVKTTTNHGRKVEAKNPNANLVAKVFRAFPGVASQEAENNAAQGVCVALATGGTGR